MKKQYLLSLLSVVILIGCKREPYPVTVLGEPEFRLSATLDGSPLTFEAGVNGIFLNSTAEQNSFGVHEFESSLFNGNCTDCEEAFTFRLNDSQILDQGDSPSPENVLVEGYLPFATEPGNADYMSVSFNVPFNPDLTYEWDFGDGNSSTQEDPEHTYANPGIYDISLHATDTDFPFCDMTIIRSIEAGNNQPCSIPFVIEEEQGEELHLHAPQNLPPYLIIQNWLINGEVFYGNDQSYDIPNGTDDISVCLFFENTESGAQGRFCIEYENTPGPDLCLNDFGIQWEAGFVNLGNVELTYVSADGITYTTLSPLNNSSDSEFLVTSVEDVEGGIGGKPARKLFIQCNAWLVNAQDSNDQIYLENLIAEMAFIY